ncbi:MAG: NAD(P)H-hydrate dehydratase, partial [Pseudomonadota bacterium]
AAAAVAQGMGGRGADAADVVLEALFGIGLSRPMPAEIVAALGPMLAPDRTPPAPALEGRTAAPRDGAAVVSVDVPAGLCADGGRPIGPAVQADMTMTFVAPKLGQFLLPGLSLCGELRFSRLIGSARPDRGGQAPRARLLRKAPQGLSKEACAPWGHKYDHGHVLAVAGGVGKGGAARLAARGALRAGAGAVTVAPPPSALQENAARLDAIMLHAVADAAALAKALKARRIDAVALGMGLGVGERAREMALAALGSGAACVLDADALTSFAEAPEPFFEALNPKAVLTPHAGEFARLFPDLAARLREDAATGPVFSKVDAALAAAERAGCAVLLKGPDTVVASRDRGADVLPARGPARAPWLATAGAGDVLAGIVAGLMARGLEAFDAASSGAWLHARAARLFGPGLVAEDLPEMLPRAFAYLASDEVADDPL